MDVTSIPRKHPTDLWYLSGWNKWLLWKVLIRPEIISSQALETTQRHSCLDTFCTGPQFASAVTMLDALATTLLPASLLAFLKKRYTMIQIIIESINVRRFQRDSKNMSIYHFKALVDSHSGRRWGTASDAPETETREQKPHSKIVIDIIWCFFIWKLHF